jgi:uncharacterized membrane protein
MTLERSIAGLLRFGVNAAGITVLAGALLFLAAHGGDRADFHSFHATPAAWSLDGRGLMQLGIAILIATPVARVAWTAAAFARARNVRFFAITAAVLAVLIYSMFGAH